MQRILELPWESFARTEAHWAILLFQVESRSIPAAGGDTCQVMRFGHVVTCTVFAAIRTEDTPREISVGISLGRGEAT